MLLYVLVCIIFIFCCEGCTEANSYKLLTWQKNNDLI